MHANLTLPGEDCSPDYHPLLTCLFKVKTSYVGSMCRVHTGPGNREKVGDFKQAF